MSINKQKPEKGLPSTDLLPWEEEPPPHNSPMTSRQQRRLFAHASNLGLMDDERREVAEMILRRDVESWKELTFSEANRLIDAFEGFEKISWLLVNKSSTARKNG